MSIEAMRQALEALDGEPPGWRTPAQERAITALRSAIEQAEKQGQHWCTYCRGHNAHNCQFNTTIPRVHTYVTNTTAPAPRQWVGLTDEEVDQVWPTGNRFEFARDIEAKLKEKNT